MEKEFVKFSLEIYSNTTWEVGEQGSFLDFNIKVYIHYSTAQTRHEALRKSSKKRKHTLIAPRLEGKRNAAPLPCWKLESSQVKGHVCNKQTPQLTQTQTRSPFCSCELGRGKRKPCAFEGSLNAHTQEATKSGALEAGIYFSNYFETSMLKLIDTRSWSSFVSKGSTACFKDP